MDGEIVDPKKANLLFFVTLPTNPLKGALVCAKDVMDAKDKIIWAKPEYMVATPLGLAYDTVTPGVISFF